jgi:PAS domain S-box-containing protein
MQGSTRAKILIVDDDQASRELYKSLLTPFGHEVLEARDGKEGLNQAQRSRPNLIISDILMPTMNGYEFVSALRKNESLRDTPVIFHSASFLDRETRSLGAACGVSLYILKPCDPEQALAVIQEALGLKIEGHVQAAPAQANADAIPLLIDAFFEKGKQLDAVSVRLASLLELGLDLARPSNLESLLAKAGDAARKTIGANYSGIGILSENGQQLRSFALFGAAEDVIKKLRNSVFDGQVFPSIVRDRKAHLAFNPFGQPPGLGLPVEHPSIHSFLGVPLQAGEHVYGWIYVADKLASLEFTEEDAHILRALAAQVAVAYENAQRFQTIEQHTKKLEIEIEERRRAENRFRMLIETAPTGIVIADQKGRIADVNAQALRMFGYGREELVGQPVECLLPERLQKSHQEHRAGYTRDPHPRPMGVGVELYARRRDGTEFPVEISLGPLATKEVTLVSATIVDITARKRMEEQLRLSQRLEAIGKLAGGVAHDFNNLLAVILGSADIALDALPPENPARRKVEMVRQAGSSAADLTRQLLAFSRQQMLQPQVLDLREIVERVQVLLGRLLGENIDLALSLEPSLGRIKADPGQIEQVLMNLAVNARDAMEKGGRLSIEARNVELDESYKEQHQPVIPGPYVMLAVEDTGCGMDTKTQARILTPSSPRRNLARARVSALPRYTASSSKVAATSGFTARWGAERFSVSTSPALIKWLLNLSERPPHPA